MHRNQYLITSDEKSVRGLDLPVMSFCGVSVFHHPSLAVTSAGCEGVNLLILGYVIDPQQPTASDSDIAFFLAERCLTREDLFQQLQSLCGRFALLYSTTQDLIVVGDACGARQIYYSLTSNGFLLTSSVQAFWDHCCKAPETSPCKRMVLALDAYEKSERAWFGSGSPDDRLNRVLPNHYLDLTCGTVKRVPVDQTQLADEKDACEFVATVLKGSLKAISKRFRVVLALTAGFDSRTNLAACKEMASEIESFVFAQPDEDERAPDICIPLRLTGKLGLPFSVVRPAKVRADFLEHCRRERIEPQPARLPEIQYLYDQYSGRNFVRVGGHAADIMKSSFYGHTRRRVTSDMLYAFSGYYGKSLYVKEQIDKWLEGAEPYCKENSIRLPDLFYWEQRIGIWGALYAFEQDVATEEYWPHGNRNLLLSALRIHPRRRSRPECRFYLELISRLWNEALLEPCNPLSLVGKLNWRLRNNSLARYYKLKVVG